MTLPARVFALLRRLIPVALAWAMLAGPALATADQARTPWDLCAEALGRAGSESDLPPHLLIAIAKVESGRWSSDSQENLAWPWTVTAEGQGRHLPSKAAAMAAVAALRARGVTSIDVGCMQINLRHHPDAFPDLDAAFNPVSNVAYAAQLLRSLRQQSGSWTRAVGNYHSATPTLSGPYRVKVFRALFEERRRAQQARRATR
jgi:soluble lytic murein transglycosylase-like protein